MSRSERGDGILTLTEVLLLIILITISPSTLIRGVCFLLILTDLAVTILTKIARHTTRSRRNR